MPPCMHTLVSPILFTYAHLIPTLYLCWFCSITIQGENSGIWVQVWCALITMRHWRHQ